MFVVTLKKAGLKKVGVGVICCALAGICFQLGMCGRDGSCC